MPPLPTPATLTWPNGARAVLEHRPHAASAAVVLRLAGGTREEGAHEAGHTHLLEHLLLRRTARCDAGALAERMAALGGEVNAETGREHLLLHGRAPAAQAAQLAALLVECACAPAFEPRDLAPEWGVLAAERSLAGQARAHDALVRLAWPEHALGRPLDPPAQSPASVRELAALHARLACGVRLRAAVVGAFDPDTLRAALAPLASLPSGRAPEAGTPPRFVPGRYGEPDPTQPAQLWWALPCTPFDLTRTSGWALAAVVLEHSLATALRGRGLAYACATWPEIYSDAGLIVVRVAAPAGAARACVETVEDCIERLAGNGPGKEEIARARAMLRARAALARDDALARATALAHPVLRPCIEDLYGPAGLTPGAWLRLVA